jgi:hypothetical protein
MTIIRNIKIKGFLQSFLLTLGIFSGFHFSTLPIKAANIKHWKLHFFNDLGTQVGSGNFSYDLDTTTFIATDQGGDGFFVQTELISFSANVLGITWDFDDRSGQLWWEPSSKTAKGTIFGRSGIFEGDRWFFGDQFFGEEALVLSDSSGGEWIQITDFSTFDEGIWTAEQVPEPLTIFGTAMALGFGAMFKRKNKLKLTE